MRSKAEIQKALDAHMENRPTMCGAAGLSMEEFARRSKQVSEWSSRRRFLEYLRDTADSPVVTRKDAWRHEKMVVPAGVTCAW